jgi:uncharacterized protein (DUF2062 family)
LGYTLIPEKHKALHADVHKIRAQQHVRIRKALHELNLWHSTGSVSGRSLSDVLAFAPIPFQMIPSAATAIWLRVNLPISVALVWITNPFTMAPVFYFNYKLGAWLLRQPAQDVSFEFTLDWFTQQFAAIWQPFFLGSFVVSVLASAAGYWAMRGFWRLQTVRQWERRKRARGHRRR